MKTKNDMAISLDCAGINKIVIVGTIEIEPGRRDQLLRLLVVHRDRCLKEEPGTLEFKVIAPYDDDTKLLVYEIYQDSVAFDVHRNGPSIAQFRKETAGMVAKMSFTKCALVE
jgi:quinol monooxygenase YgiN